jgi:hypothetical protein
VHILDGLAATAMAAVMVASWIAVGSIFVEWKADNPASVPAAILVGSGVASFLLALASLSGMVTGGTIAVEAAIVACLMVRRRVVASLIRAPLGALDAAAVTPVIKVSMWLLGAVMWTSAIAPPRNADAMRYHLAHIGQIVTDGRWTPIRDFHYALPFGWTFNFLPFELTRLPQGAQLLSLALFIVITACVCQSLSNRRENVVLPLIAVSLMLHPFIVRAFADPTADPYSLLVVAATCLVLIGWQTPSSRDAATIGFVIWIGMQSRYQLAAIAIPASLIWLWTSRRPARAASSKRVVLSWFAGAGVALVLASPFYLVNYLEFRNPVWPLLIRSHAQVVDYASAVAAEYAQSLGGEHTAADWLYGIKRLATTASVFPIPIIVVTAVGASLFSKRDDVRRLGLLGAGFMILWLLMQPRLYPRFVILLVPLTALLIGLMLESKAKAERTRGWLSRLASGMILMLALTTGAVSLDYIRYVVTGNLPEYHRFTWYYPTYQWANANTPRHARFLVIVSSGHSYYLHRPYRRADPWLSGVIDWKRTRDAEALRDELEKGKYDYLIYQDRDWSAFPGGSQAMAAIRSAVDSGDLVAIHTFDEKLYSSRIERRFATTRLIIFKVRQDPTAGRHVSAGATIHED